jgi:hypothetical protein
LCVALIAIAASYVSDILSEPPPLAISQQYNKEYNSKADEMLAQHEFENLKKKEKEYFNQLSGPENTDAAVQYILARKMIIVPITSLLWFLFGLKAGFYEKKYIAVSVLMIAAFGIVFVNVIESLLYTVFFIGGNMLLLRKVNK